MHLLYPIGLIALAGLLIPLIIHLWKLKQGKTLQIGSIALLGASSPFTSRSYQITDWLLLFLRMLLIALLAFFLAEPYFFKKNTGNGLQKGWVLTEKAYFPILYKTEKKSLDSLLLAGYELHDFGLGFQKMSLNDTVPVSSGIDTSSFRKAAKLSYPALLNELNARIEPDFPVYLYADHRLQHLEGDLPQVDYRLIWKEIKGTDTLATWRNTFANKTFEASSSPTLTSFKRLDDPREESVIKVLIYETEHPEDVKYLKAAIQAIAQETKRKIELIAFNDNISSDLSFDVGFWISTKPVSKAFFNHMSDTGRLFNYAGEKLSMTNSWLEPGNAGNNEAMGLRKRMTSANYPGTQIWTDGFGTPLLTLAKENKLTHYRFYSRMNPGWTDLVWNAQFVPLMMPVLLGNAETDHGFGFEISPADQRISAVPVAQYSRQSKVYLPAGAKTKPGSRTIENAAMEPGDSGNAAELSVSSQKEQPLQKVLWLIALLVFTLERIISYRLKSSISHG
ncbi:BatA domain-containing protein [Pedobacter gandavensis]|uniref:BatA domain-containing protein n=1 Tax=Pedobacter gandavensis TaxID=2679963 RepID=UPI001600B75A|nr:BatA domain-containing protein [Pedobacter gandavensis]